MTTIALIVALALGLAAALAWLIALEFGRVDEGQPPENWEGVSEKFGLTGPVSARGASQSRPP